MKNQGVVVMAKKHGLLGLVAGCLLGCGGTVDDGFPADEAWNDGSLAPMLPGQEPASAPDAQRQGAEADQGHGEPTSTISEALTYSSYPLTGDKYCKWGASNCNRCVYDVPGEFDIIGNSYRYEGRIRFDGYAYPTTGYLLHRIDGAYEHVQSIGRIAGIGNQEYMAFTHSTDSGQPRKNGALAIVRMGADQSSGGYAFGGMPYGDGSNQNNSNRTVARAYTSNNHPGGLSVLGHYVYVAQWCQPHGNYGWCPESSSARRGMGFSVYDVSQVGRNAIINSHPPIERYYHHVYGEPWIGTSSTASVGAVRLSNGVYMAALGKASGRAYGFYLAWNPTGPYYFHSHDSIGYWGENATIVTECGTGHVYMFQLEKYANSADKAHLYRLLVTPSVGLEFQYVKSRTFYCAGGSLNGASKWCDFDAGASMYVTPHGDLALYATEHHQSSHGNIRLVEFY